MSVADDDDDSDLEHDDKDVEYENEELDEWDNESSGTTQPTLIDCLHLLTNETFKLNEAYPTLGRAPQKQVPRVPPVRDKSHS